jgi:hypothetical protein
LPIFWAGDLLFPLALPFCVPAQNGRQTHIHSASGSIQMKFWIETDNLAVDTEEVSDHFYDLCRQKAERDSNRLWESPGREMLVIVLSPTEMDEYDLYEKLDAVWSEDVSFARKAKLLDDVSPQDTLIKIYPTIPNVPYRLVEKKKCYTVSYYRYMELNGFYYGSIEEMPGMCHFTYKLIEEYKVLEKYALPPSVQGDATKRPSGKKSDNLGTPLGTPSTPEPKKPGRQGNKLYDWFAKKQQEYRENGQRRTIPQLAEDFNRLTAKERAGILGGSINHSSRISIPEDNIEYKKWLDAIYSALRRRRQNT